MPLLTFIAAAAMPPMMAQERIVRPVDCRPALVRTAAAKDAREPAPRARPRQDERPRVQRRCFSLASA